MTIVPGGKDKISDEQFARVKSPDKEIFWHTHPDQEFAVPSTNDIMTFLESPQRTTIIIADNDVLILQKTKKTKKTRDAGNYFVKELKTPDIWLFEVSDPQLRALGFEVKRVPMESLRDGKVRLRVPVSLR